MTLKKLSSAPEGLHHMMNSLRNLVATHSSQKLIDANGNNGALGDATLVDNFDKIKAILASEENNSGDFYKYYFDRKSEVEAFPFADPDGNNILLLVIARAAFSPLNKESVKYLVSFIIKDAQIKLNPEELHKFLGFSFVNDKLWYKGYENTPMTLAVKVGLITSANEIFDSAHKADSNVTSITNFQEGLCGYTPLHILMTRIPLTAGSAEELELLGKLSGCTDKGIKDNSGRTAADLMQLRFILPEDATIFRPWNANKSEILGLARYSENEELLYYSFKDIINSDKAKTFFEKQGFKFESSFTIEHINSFKTFVKGVDTTTFSDRYLIAQEDLSESVSKLYTNLFNSVRVIDYDQDIATYLDPLSGILTGSVWGYKEFTSFDPYANFYTVGEPSVLGKVYEVMLSD